MTGYTQRIENRNLVIRRIPRAFPTIHHCMCVEIGVIKTSMSMRFKNSTTFIFIDILIKRIYMSLIQYAHGH